MPSSRSITERKAARNPISDVKSLGKEAWPPKVKQLLDYRQIRQLHWL